MKITYDKQADAMYIYLQPQKKVKETKEVGENTIVDIAENGDIIGIEILGVQEQMDKKDMEKLKQEFTAA